MNFTTEKLPKSIIKITFNVDKSALDEAILKAYNRTKSRYNIPGFRKGHAPKKVIEGMYGNVFYSDAVNDLIDEGVRDFSENGGERVASFDSVDSIKDTEDGGVEFVVSATIYPEVKLGAYKGLEIEKKVEKVTQKQIDEYIRGEQKKQERKVTVDGEAEMGHTVVIDFVGTIDGVPFENGAGKDHHLTLGSNSFIPGFESGLVGVKAGESRVVKVTFPEDYGAEELAGKEAEFACDVKEVYRTELPEIDDEFVKDISEDLDTLAEYKTYVKGLLTKQAEHEAEHKYLDDLIDAIVDGAEVEIPDPIVEQELEDELADMDERLKAQGFTLEEYTKYLGITVDQIKDQNRQRALEQCKIRLVFEQIIKEENITVEKEDIDAAIAKMAERKGVSVDEVKSGLDGATIDYIANTVLQDKLFDFFKANNSVKKPAKKTKAKAAEESVEEAQSAEEVKVEEKAEDEAAKPKKPAAKKTSAKKSAKKTDDSDGAAE